MTQDRIAALIAAEGLPRKYRGVVEDYWVPLANQIAECASRQRPLIFGINGAQGSGKSTLCRFLELLLGERGLKAVTLSLDDLYLGRAERSALAKRLHPLFATRGVPGTHDTGLGRRILDEFRQEAPVTPLPRFDKATDDRAAEEIAPPAANVLLFEGWCVGAIAQPLADLTQPVNALEAEEDADGTWRREVNSRLTADYASLFRHIDALVMLKVADFSVVRVNRRLQEEKLAAARPGSAALMDDASLDRFLAHYERLTRWMLAEMPGRADIVIEIGSDQRPFAMHGSLDPWA